MVKFDVEGSQNVEVSKKIPCEKPLIRQLEIMETYTAVHKKYSGSSKARREVECLKVIFPEMFRSIERQDLIAGRLDFLPIGFGTVTSIGGVGHYLINSGHFKERLKRREKSMHNGWKHCISTGWIMI